MVDVRSSVSLLTQLRPTIVQWLVKFASVSPKHPHYCRMDWSATAKRNRMHRELPTGNLHTDRIMRGERVDRVRRSKASASERDGPIGEQVTRDTGFHQGGPRCRKSSGRCPCLLATRPTGNQIVVPAGVKAALSRHLSPRLVVRVIFSSHADAVYR